MPIALGNPFAGAGAELVTTEMVDGEGNPIELDGIANDKLSPMSKLTRWLAAFGVVAKHGEDVDMEDAIDKVLHHSIHIYVFLEQSYYRSQGMRLSIEALTA